MIEASLFFYRGILGTQNRGVSPLLCVCDSWHWMTFLFFLFTYPSRCTKLFFFFSLSNSLIQFSSSLLFTYPSIYHSRNFPFSPSAIKEQDDVDNLCAPEAAEGMRVLSVR